MRCNACRRPLTNPVSIRHGLGPDCLKRAVKAGNASIEALAELTAYQRGKPKRTKAKAPPVAIESTTLDLFAGLREAAIDDLHKAAEVCRSLGLVVTINF